jgi:hypothetical protein
LNIEHPLKSAAVIGNYAYLGCKKYLYEYSLNGFKEKRKIKFEHCIRKIIKHNDDTLIIGFDFGHMILLDISEWKTVAYQLKERGGVKDIIATSRTNEYAVATLHGLLFINISKSKGVLKLKENKELYLKGYYTRSVIEYKTDIFIVCVNEDNNIYMIDRLQEDSRPIVQTSLESDRCLMLYSWPTTEIEVPYIFWRDEEHIGLLDMANYKSHTLVQSKFIESAGHKGLDFQMFLMISSYD